MAFDFNYENSTIQTTGGLKPGKKNAPVDIRTVVDTYADILSIPNPYVGLTVTVKADETNSGKMTDYKVISLKANSLGVADAVVNEVKRMSEYLEVTISGGGGAVPSDYASKSYVDTSKEEAKEYADSAINSALDGHTFKFLTQAEYDVLPDEEKNNPTIEYHITDSNNSENIDTSNLASDLSLTGSSLQLKNSNGSLIGNSVNIPQKTSDLTNDSKFATTSYVDAQIAKIEISGGSSELANLIIII